MLRFLRWGSSSKSKANDNNLDDELNQQLPYPIAHTHSNKSYKTPLDTTIHISAPRVLEAAPTRIPPGSMCRGSLVLAATTLRQVLSRMSGAATLRGCRFGMHNITFHRPPTRILEEVTARLPRASSMTDRCLQSFELILKTCPHGRRSRLRVEESCMSPPPIKVIPIPNKAQHA